MSDTPLLLPKISSRVNRSPRVIKTIHPKKSMNHVSFNPSILTPLDTESTSHTSIKMPKLAYERSRFINEVCNLIYCLHLTVEQMLPVFEDIKNKYINNLKQLNASQSFIDNEINTSLIHIMRQLYFTSN